MNFLGLIDPNVVKDSSKCYGNVLLDIEKILLIFQIYFKPHI